MIQSLQILKIHLIFTRNQCTYIVFSTNKSNNEFVYIKHLNNNVKSLLFGKDLHKSISKILNNQDIECIECYLGSQVLGGISYDTGDLIANNISLKESNQIIFQLKKALKSKSSIIEYFKLSN
ncbi:MAG: hypothetical protein ACFFHD_08330 [Promethearchaeota archaeon]